MNKKKRDTMYSIWSALIFLSVMLVLFSLLFASFTKDYGTRDSKKTNTEVAATATDATEAGVQMLNTAALLTQTADAGNEYTGKLTFLCDSTTTGLKTNSLLPDGAETTKVLSTSDGKLSLSGISGVKLPSGTQSVSIADAVKAANPEILVITLGEDGAAFMGQEFFTSSYTGLIKSIKDVCPNVTIICNSILPVSQTYATANSMNADTIRQANNWVQQAAADNGCRYADSFSALSGTDGYLLSQYDSGDGLVPNADGLTAMINYLRLHAVT